MLPEKIVHYYKWKLEREIPKTSQSNYFKVRARNKVPSIPLTENISKPLLKI